MESIGNNVYRIEAPVEDEYIIFSNTGSSQTATINIDGYGKIYQNGGWSDHNG